jgi:hypothetical protein
VERSQFNSAIQKLALLDRSAAGPEALACATQLLPIAAKYYTPADRAAIWSLAIALYFSAVAAPGQKNSATLWAVVEDSYVKLRRNASEDVFPPLVHYPEPLDELLRELARLPRTLVIAGVESLRSALHNEASQDESARLAMLRT